MSYAQYNSIDAADFNTLVSTGSPNLNNIWSTGSGNSGYGQSAVSTVSPGQTISASGQWNSLISNIITSASHQGTALSAWSDSNPLIGDTILHEVNMNTNLSAIDATRLNAVAQGSTSNFDLINTSTWYEYSVFTFTITFSSGNASRHYFNAGGQIGLQFYHPAGTVYNINQLISDICSDSGTVWISSPTSGTVSLASVNYNGVTKVGGANPAGTTISSNLGLYALNTVAQEIFRQTSDFYYFPYGNSYLKVDASYDISTGVIVLSVTVDKVPNTSPSFAVVSGGTQSTLLIRYPSTTYLANSWGTPTINTSISSV